MGLATQLFKDTRRAGPTASAKPVLMPKFIGESNRGRKVYGSGNLHPAPCLVIMRRTGCQPRRLELPISSQKQVNYMRNNYQITITDCHRARHYTLTQLMCRARWQSVIVIW